MLRSTKGSHSYCTARANESFPMTGTDLGTGVGARLSEENFGGKGSVCKMLQESGRFASTNLCYTNYFVNSRLSPCLSQTYTNQDAVNLKLLTPISTEKISSCPVQTFLTLLDSSIHYRHLREMWRKLPATLFF